MGKQGSAQIDGKGFNGFAFFFDIDRFRFGWNAIGIDHNAVQRIGKTGIGPAVTIHIELIKGIIVRPTVTVRVQPVDFIIREIIHQVRSAIPVTVFEAQVLVAICRKGDPHGKTAGHLAGNTHPGQTKILFEIVGKTKKVQVKSPYPGFHTHLAHLRV